MKSINWLDHIANLLVVILGISIAFYLESYKEDSSNRKQEKRYLESMQEDLETDIEALDTLIYYNKSIMGALDALTSASIGRSPTTDSALVWHIMLIQYNPPFTPQRTTYESLKSSGNLELIGDFELRSNVVDLYEQEYLGASQFDEVLNEHVRDFVKPYYMKKIRFKRAGMLDPSFLDDGEFRNIVFTYQYLFGRKNDFYKETRKRTAAAVSGLEAYLADLK